MRDTAHKSLPTQKNTKLYGRHRTPYNLVFIWCFNLQNGQLRKVTIHIFESHKTPQYRTFQHFRLLYGGDKLLLKKENPLAVGPYDISNYYMEHKKQQAEAMKNARSVILSTAKKFEELTGRRYAFFEEYEMEDAEAALVIIGSSAGTAREAARQLRLNGKKVGLIKIRVFRPFPMHELAAAMSGVKAAAVMDKAESFSACGGPLFAEVRSALYDLKNKPHVINYVYGLGGRDICVEHFEMIYNQLFEIAETGNPGEVYRHIGQREQEGEK